ncbi:sugar nucleotidyltransferase [Helicobacter sp. CLO-3]|uniref:phosphocholine cytidylyltransferase family protein n=1 Tax=unclassified Helicobacter TaxID=2593540 RepID=UPI000805E61E|nr:MULTISPECIES: phosphocholine cytidylyltransferase family protein [unclassified Helicobacter]OBV28459.1 sugar nucleotidyltransferase [Helicobacter sp. CLO-3]OHU81207.1 sugar nucleotidyltransferase [Helicobacter sp. CLO-3]
MKALILAAGFGSRLMPLTVQTPKCMVSYQGQKILDYEIKALRENNIDEIAIVGGYLYDTLQDYARAQGITKLYRNEKYDCTNMVSTLFCARDFLNLCAKTKEDIIISYADIVYSKGIVAKLLECNMPLGIVVDKKWRELWKKRFENPLDDAETMKLDGNRILELGKKPKSYDEIQGQYIGLFKISHAFLPQVIGFYDELDRGSIYDGKDFPNMYMTSFLQALIDRFCNAHAVEIYGGWMEIDAKSDLEILPC